MKRNGNGSGEVGFPGNSIWDSPEEEEAKTPTTLKLNEIR